MIAFRIALALAVAGAGYMIGSMFADRLRRRVSELDEWQALLQLLQSDVAYGALELPRALEKIARTLRAPTRGFVLRVARRLQGHVRVQDVWREELERLRPLSCLWPEDVVALGELGDALGQFGREEHARHLEHAIARIGVQRQRAADERGRGERLWRTLGVTAGMALALLLL